jgi:hypothetical protein
MNAEQKDLRDPMGLTLLPMLAAGVPRTRLVAVEQARAFL